MTTTNGHTPAGPLFPPAMIRRRAAGTVAYLGGLHAVLENFAWAWGQMVAYNADHMADAETYIHTDRARVSDHAIARNSLVERFLGDWLVMLDTDHEFDPDIVARLVNSANAYGLDVLTGVYLFKSEPHYPVLYEWMPSKDGDDVLRQIMGWENMGPGFLEIGSAGAGCLFVRRSIFDRMREELADDPKLRGAPFDRVPPYSEDHSFFLRLRALGVTPFVATHIHSPHLSTVRVLDVTSPPTAPGTREDVEVGGWMK